MRRDFRKLTLAGKRHPEVHFTIAGMACGWRREHAHRVYSAIGALVMAAYAWDRGASLLSDPEGKDWVRP